MSGIILLLTVFAYLSNSAAPVKAQDRLPWGSEPFRLDYYAGRQERAILALYKAENINTAICYGLFINWQVGLVPCSCVCKPPPQNQIATAWNHKRAFPVQAENPNRFEVGVMFSEYFDRNRHFSQVDEIALSPRCNTTFQVNVAKILLHTVVFGSKLAWIALPNESKMKDLLKRSLIGLPTRGICQVYRWVSEINRNNRQVIRLRSFIVTIDSWSNCVDNVCPLDAGPPTKEKIDWDAKICLNSDSANRTVNRTSRSRYCLYWAYPENMICELTPGTPVFCHEGDITGVVGFLHDQGFYCPKKFSYKHRVMEGIDKALHLIWIHMRVLNAYVSF